jgi:integrase/recombinase XerD
MQLSFITNRYATEKAFFFDIPRPQKPLILPEVSDEGAVGKLLAAAGNAKHKLLLSLSYGSKSK